VTNEVKQKAVIAEVIRILSTERQRQNISMNQLAARSGLSQSLISLLERGRRNPTLETLLRISDVLEVDLGTIITRACKNLPKTSSG